MSAGYDGKTILWDVGFWFLCLIVLHPFTQVAHLLNSCYIYFQIWEGIPIRTYDIGRFKLVDGKFSQ